MDSCHGTLEAEKLVRKQLSGPDVSGERQPRREKEVDRRWVRGGVGHFSAGTWKVGVVAGRRGNVRLTLVSRLASW